MFVNATAVCVLALASAAPDDPDSFEREVRPLLAARCVGCHGPKEQKGGLRLDTAAFLARVAGDDAVVHPGDPGKSPLIRAIRREGDLKMPPKAKLAEDEVAILTRWVASGAAWPKGEPARPKVDMSRLRDSHWSFRPVVSPAIPGVKDPRWPATDIDRFILAALEAKGLRPSPPAERRTLIRRATFDLIGLPPTPEESEAFVNDRAPDAFAKVVDRLLASPRYGERWARHWLDLARYADTRGYVDGDELRGNRFPFSYTYRDWVIRAFNADMPYDAFLLRQIAADRLEHDDDHTTDLAALGFLTLHRDLEQNEDKIIEDRIDVLTRTTLGLTVACARCHDHKFDPIPQEDYYSLRGVFEGSAVEEVPILNGPEDRPALEAYNRERNRRRYAFEDAVELHGRAEFGPIRSARSIERYLLAAQDRIDRGDDGMEGGERADGLDPAILDRWKDYLAGNRDEPHPVLGPWSRLAKLDAEGFAAAAPAIVKEYAAEPKEGGEPAVNARVAAMLREHPPASLADLARSYGTLLAGVDAGWSKRYREARKSLAEPPDKLDDDADEELRQILYGDGSPTLLISDFVAERINSRDDGEAVDALRELQTRVEEWKEDPSAPPHATALKDPEQPGQPRVFLRGNPESPGDEVPRRFLALLSPADRKPFEDGSGRLELARAIVDPRNPLTARVLVNRVWMHHFGRGLVRTPSDFGTRGEPPTHPELLDHLAARFVAEGWSIKRLHRAILLSNVYRQSSGPDPAAQRVDPDNRMLWRFERHRLEVEPLRDAMLAVGGTLEDKLGGRPVDLAANPNAPRRTVYALIDRMQPLALFSAFDAANPDLHTPLRHATTVPPQGLYLLNSPAVVDQARAFAKRLAQERPGDPAGQVRHAYALALGRPAEAAEIARVLRFLDDASKLKAIGPEPVPVAWKYGFAALDEKKNAPAGFRELAHFAEQSYRGGEAYPDPKLSYLALNADGGHPGDDLAHSAVRRWVAPGDGVVTIDGTLAHKLDEADESADGVRGHIVSSRMGVLGEWVVFKGDAATKLTALPVKAGESIDFVVDCRKNPSNDTYTWKVKLTGLGTVFASADDFEGPRQPPPPPLSPLEKFAQVMLMSNEFLFVD